MTKYSRQSNRAGFTLIEFIVAFGLFAIILSISVGGFIRALKVQRQLVALASANSNVSLAIEQMTREMRLGRDFSTSRNVTDDDTLNFSTIENGITKNVSYQYFEEDGIRGIRRVESATIAVVGDSLESESITSNNVSIQYLRFFLQQPITSSRPTRVTIVIGVSPKEAGISENIIRLQTSVTPR